MFTVYKPNILSITIGGNREIIHDVTSVKYKKENEIFSYISLHVFQD